MNYIFNPFTPDKPKFCKSTLRTVNYKYFGNYVQVNENCGQK
jgi:hypothetical protein